MIDEVKDDVIEEEVAEEDVEEGVEDLIEEGAEEEVEEDREEGEAEEEDVDESGKAVDKEGDEAERLIVDLDDEPEVPAPDWVRDLRKRNRELQRENREYREKLNARQVAPVLGEKPKLADFDYDEEQFEQSLSAWYARKREVDAAAKREEEEQAAIEKAWNDRLAAYAHDRDEFSARAKVTDYADAEAVVEELFNQPQQGVALHVSENPARTIYTLGKNPQTLKRLSENKDPLKLAYALGRLEAQMAAAPRKPAAMPEKRVTGSGSKTSSSDSHHEKLLNEAMKTGDMTKVIRYESQRAKKK